MCFRPATAEKMKNICTKCNAVNPAAAPVCVKCGAKLRGLPPLPGQAGGLDSAPPAPPKKPES